jgi:thiol-disulfide isomerase/thioredoxin
VIVDFWATWCAPCAEQIPVLNEFQADHYGEVVVLGIAVDPQGIEVVAPYADEHDIQYPVLLGSESLAQAYGAFGFPSLYVIAPDGVIAAKHVGVITREELEEALVAVAARAIRRPPKVRPRTGRKRPRGGVHRVVRRWGSRRHPFSRQACLRAKLRGR